MTVHSKDRTPASITEAAPSAQTAHDGGPMTTLTKAKAAELANTVCGQSGDKLLLAIHYGSSSPGSTKPLRDGSDVDLLLIARTDQDAMQVSHQAAALFAKEGVPLDMLVGSADRLVKQLEARQHVLVYRDVLEHGTLLAADPEFERRLRALLVIDDQPDILRATLALSRDEAGQYLKGFVRTVVNAVEEVFRHRLLERRPGMAFPQAHGLAPILLEQRVADPAIVQAWARLMAFRKEGDGKPSTMPQLDALQEDYRILVRFLDEADAQAAAVIANPTGL